MQKKQVTLGDVAELAGVSRSAVSRTFTPGASVSDAMRSRIMQAADRLGYRPNILARSLTTGQTGLVGLVANNFQNPAYLKIFDRFTQQLQRKGLRPLLINLTDETNPKRSLDLLMQYQVDAVLIATSTLPVEFVSAFANAGLPVVHAFGQDSEGLYPVVSIDNVRAGEQAAIRLLASGYRSLGFIGGPENSTSTQDRLAGFMKVVNDEKGVQFEVHYASDYTFDAGFIAMTNLLERPPLRGYFCGDDVISIGVMSALNQAGFSVPHDVGLIGFNDIDMAGWGNVRLTTIAQPFEALIDLSVELLEQMLHSDVPVQPTSQFLTCDVIERDTLTPVL